MKNTKKAFTLVELIVVITILAVLATVAFISLTGHAQDAKNSKVSSDLRTLTSALETKATKDGTLAHTLVKANTTFNTNNTMSGSSLDYASGSAIAGSVYAIGTVDFAALGQNGDDFKDSNNPARDYIFAAVGTRYQLAGEIIKNDVATAVVKGNYVQDNGASTATGLISESGYADMDSLTNGTAATVY